MSILLFITGSIVGAFIMGVIALYAHLNHVADLRSFHQKMLQQREQRAYARGYESRAALEFKHRRENL